MNSEIVGVTRISTTGPKLLDIIAFNMTTRKTTVIEAKDPGLFTFVGSFMVDNDLHLVVEVIESNESTVYFCPGHLLPYDDIVEASSDQAIIYPTVVARPSPLNTGNGPILGPESGPFAILSTDDMRGRSIVSLTGTIGDPGEPCFLEVTFWRRPEKPVCKILPSHTVLIPGSVQEGVGSWTLVLLTPSGLSLLLVMKNEGKSSMQLVRFNPDTDTSSIHELKLPPSINLDDVAGLSLDDNCGTLSLVDSSGILRCISYA